MSDEDAQRLAENDFDRNRAAYEGGRQDAQALITSTLQAYERGYARGMRDALALVRAWSDEQTTMDAGTMTNDLETLLTSLETHAVPKVVGNQEPKEADPHE